MPLYICGFILLGVALQKHLSIGVLVMGWGIAEVAIMVNTVAVCRFLYSRPIVQDSKDPSSPQLHTSTTASRKTRAKLAHC
jgi:hypothetical protein